MATQAITDHWSSLKKRGIDLGAPQGGEQDAGYGGKFQDYEHGRIYWHGSTGAHALQGRLLQRYVQAGGQDVNPATGERELGFPTSDHIRTADGLYECATFEWGIIADVAGTALVRLFGTLYNAWQGEGGALGRLGHPIDDVAKLEGGRAAWFERGVIWHPDGQDAMIVGELVIPTLGKPLLVDPDNPGTFEWMRFDGAVLPLDSNPKLATSLMAHRLSLQAVGGGLLDLLPGGMSQHDGQRWLSFGIRGQGGGGTGPLHGWHGHDVLSGVAVATDGMVMSDGGHSSGGTAVTPQPTKLEKRQLYSLVFQTPGLAPRVISPHCLYARSDWETFGIAHVTDVHASRRLEHYRTAMRQRGVSDADVALFNNYNDNFRNFIRYANHLHHRGLLDLIIITGDLVDFVHEADDHPDGPGNFFYFEKLILGQAPGHDPESAPSEELQVPIFTSLGNHDYRTLPYPLGFKIDISSGDVASGILGSIPVIGDSLSATFDSLSSVVSSFPGVGLITQLDPIRILSSFKGAMWQFYPQNLTQEEALKIMGLKIGDSYGVPALHPEAAGRAVRIDKPMYNGTSYYFRHINPTRSYVVPLGKHRVVMLDTRWDQGIVDSLGEVAETWLGLGTESMENFVSGNPDSVGVNEDEIAMLRNTLNEMGTDGMAIVGMHAQPINPTGNFTYNFMRETAHPTAEPEQMYGYLARNDPAMTVLEGHVPLPSPHAAELHPGWTQTGSPYMHKGEIDDMLDFGGAVGNKEEFAQVIAGKDVNRAVNIVLCGHGHFRIDYRVQWDANAQQLEQYTDHYLGNPDAYYATYYAGKEWWKVSEHKRYLVRIKEGAPPSGELLNIRDDRGTIWPDLSTMNVPPYPTPLSPSTDAKQWWQFHSPLVVQTAAIGPTSSNTRAALSTNTSAPNPVFTGFRLLQMESNVITNIQYVLAADLKNQYPLPWEPIPERLKDALEHIKDLGVAILEETSQPGQPAQPAPPQPAQPAPEPTAEPVHPMGSPVVRDHRTHH